MVLSKSKIPVCLLSAFLVASSLDRGYGQETPPAAPEPTGLAAVFAEAEKAFGAKDYTGAAAKLEELLKAVATNPNAPLEMLHFNIGLAYLLAEKYPEAEKYFGECVKRFPKGEYASRSSLGMGRALIAQNTPEKKERAIQALKLAAADPKYRSEAGLSLGQLYNELGKKEESLQVFRSLMGSDIRTPQQTNAAVEVIGLLAATDQLEDLVAYLDRLINQVGVRNAIAWYANQVVVRGDELGKAGNFEAALAVYRSIPPRRQILEIQRVGLLDQKKELAKLEKRVKDEEKLAIAKRSNVAEMVNDLKAAITMSEQALAAIEGKADLDAALLMRRGSALFSMDRLQEALVCFQTIRREHADSPDVQAAAYNELFIFNNLKKTTELQKLADDFLRKYPDAANLEQVAMLAGEGLAKAGLWAEVLKFYADLQQKFPQSSSLDRYMFLQGVAMFQLQDFKSASTHFTKFIETFPNSALYEDALYRVAMAYFVLNDYKKTMSSCADYLRKFPEGRYTGDVRYRLAFIDFNDKETKPEKVIKDITAFLASREGDPATGPMLNLLGDTYSQRTFDPKEVADPEAKAIDAYKRAIWTESADDVIQYAVENATVLMQGKKDWAGIAELHTEILHRKPGSQLALIAATWVAKMKVREGKGDEAATILATSLADTLGDPANEEVEFLIDQLVQTLVPPRRKQAEVNVDELDKKLVDVLTKAATGKENPTTNARTYYARARLADSLRQPEKADLYLKGIANNTKDPVILSPALLAVCGDILMKEGKLEEAGKMYQRLADRYKFSQFADAGPVGLAAIAMAKKNKEGYTEALAIFEDVLANSSGSSRFHEATLGKLESMIELGQYDEADKFAEQIIGDKQFRGPTVAKAYLLRALLERKKSTSLSGSEANDALARANAYYMRVQSAFQAYPDICGDGWKGAVEVLREMGKTTEADETLQRLKDHQKLKNTAAAKWAETQ